MLAQLPPPPAGKTGWPWTEAPEPPRLPAEMPAWPKITIVTPSYGQAQYIEETLRSVLLQGYPNLEYIVMDGGSTDGTREILEKYGPWLTHWASEPDKGQSDAINKGMALATGDIFNWLNSDDYYQPGALFTVAQVFGQQKALCVTGHSRKFGSGFTDAISRGTNLYPQLEQTIGWARIDQPETFFAREAVQKMGPVDQRLHYCMDRDWWIKYLLHCGLERVVHIPDVLVNFRLHDQSKTVSLQERFEQERDTIFYQLALRYGQQTLAQTIQQLGKVVELKGYTFDCKAEADKTIIIGALHHFLLLRAMEAYESDNRKEAGKLFGVIDTKYLSPEAAAQYRRQYLRHRLLPGPLLKWVRRFTR